jgi:hypothetical protein
LSTTLFNPPPCNINLFSGYTNLGARRSSHFDELQGLCREQSRAPLKSVYAEAPYSDTANGQRPIFISGESFSFLLEVGRKLLVRAGFDKERVESFTWLNGFT